MRSGFAKRGIWVLALVGAAGAGGWWWRGGDPGSGLPEERRGAEERRGEVERVGSGAGVGADGAGSFPEAKYPEVATERLIRVTLGMLAKNGADLSKPMASRHRVLAADAEVVERVAAWARSAGYVAGEPLSYHEHGGEEHFQVDLVRVGVPEPAEIEGQGREVFGAVGRIRGAYYQTWLGEVVR